MQAMLPRYDPGSIKLNEGTGPITAICSCGDFLEIFKIDKTFRVSTPEAIDSQDSGPTAAWTAPAVANVGSSHRIVARVLLQGQDVLKLVGLDKQVNKEAAIKHLHGCKEALLTCEKIAARVGSQVDVILRQFSAQDAAVANGAHSLTPLPRVPDLKPDCGAFLGQANRAVQLICELPQFFIALDQPDSNFDHLGARLEKTIGAAAPVTQFVKTNAKAVQYLIDLRNYHERPAQARTVIDNFRIDPQGAMLAPTWSVANSGPKLIKESMFDAIRFLIEIVEELVIHLAIHRASRLFGYAVEEIPAGQTDPRKPVKYKLSMYLKER